MRLLGSYARPILIAALLVGASGLYLLTRYPRAGETPTANEGPSPGDAGESPVANAGAKVKYYRSTMMPGEVSDTPRKDSMGMDMVPVYESESSMFELSEHARAMASVETTPVQRRALTREIRAVGKVQYNETALADVVSRVDGYVERLFVEFTGVEVKVGDHLVEIYSPDLVVAQQELLIALESPQSPELVESATQKLLRWGLTSGQVDALKRTRKIQERVTLFSPIAGTVTEKRVVRKSAIAAGDVLYRLANLESVWVYLDIYESELPWVQYGQTVDIRAEAYPGEDFVGRVWFISPVLDEPSRTVKVLINIGNEGQRLKPGMYASAVIRAELMADGKPAPSAVAGQWSCPMHPIVLRPRGGECPICGMDLVQIPGDPAPPRTEAAPQLLAVPVTAVLDSGVRKLVYVEKAPGTFVPVEIVTGPRTDDAYPVLSGLSEGDRVVTRGAFLLDSQFQIRGLPSLFYKEGRGAAAEHRHTGAPAEAAEPGSADIHAGHRPASGADAHMD